MTRPVLFHVFLIIYWFQCSWVGFAQTPGKEQESVFQVVERNREAIALVGDNIYYFAELGMQEIESSRLMTEILEEAGFTVERGLSGMSPAFLAGQLQYLPLFSKMFVYSLYILCLLVSYYS